MQLFSFAMRVCTRVLLLKERTMDDNKQSHSYKTYTAFQSRESDDFQLLFEQAPFGIFYADMGGRLVKVNQNLAMLTGYTRKELLGMGLRGLMNKDKALPDAVNWNALSFNEIETATIEQLLTCKDGSLRWVRVVFSLTYDHEKRPRSLMGFVEDIEERKSAEEAQAQLLEQRHTLMETNRQLEGFLDLAGHELRTPLTSIKANVQLAVRRLRGMVRGREESLEQASASAEMANTLLERAERQVDVLNHLVRELLDVAHVQGERLTFGNRLERCDLAQLVRDVVQGCQDTYSCVLEVRAPSDRIEVCADTDRLTQVIESYLANSLHYAQGVEPVKVEVVVDKERIAKVMFYDHGFEGSSKERCQVWGPFQHLRGPGGKDGVTKESVSGLYVSKMVVEYHGGHVGMSALPDKGWIFWFTIPLAAVSTL
jgi:PAS domain S-box-containing protein